MNKNNLRNKIQIILVIVIMTLSLCTITFAWFTEIPENLLSSEDSIIITSGENLEISLTSDENNWNNYIELNNDLNLTDISSNGIDFYVPSKINSDGSAVLDNRYVRKIDKNSLNFSNYVYEIPLSFRTSRKMDVFLGNNSYSDSFVSEVENIFSSSLTRPVNELNSFSKDGISAASRVGFYEIMDEYSFYLSNEDIITCNVSNGVIINSSSINNGVITYSLSDNNKIVIDTKYSFSVLSYEKTKTRFEVLKELWICNDKYELNTSNVSFNKNGNRETYKYITKNNNQIELIEFSNDDYLNTITVGNNIASIEEGIYYQNESRKLLSFSNSDNLNIKRILIRVWIEGTDRESNKIMQGGRIKFNFAFLGINKTENRKIYNNSYSVNDLKENETIILYNDKDGAIFYYDSKKTPNDLEFSTNLIDWYPYNSQVDLSVLNSIYIRIKEDDEKFKSNVILVSFGG